MLLDSVLHFSEAYTISLGWAVTSQRCSRPIYIHAACDQVSCVDGALTTQPNWASPVAVSAKEVGVGFSWHILHTVLLPFHFHHKGVVTVVPRERTDAVGSKKLVLIQQVLQDALQTVLGGNGQQMAEDVLLLNVRVVGYLEEGQGRGWEGRRGAE